jgi:hypothetical protein
MTVGIFEIHPAPAVIAIDRAGALLAGIGPVLLTALAQTGEDLVELVFRYQKSIVLCGNLAFGVVKIEGDAVGELDHKEGPNRVGFGRPKTSARKVADLRLSRHQTMVWLSCTLMSCFGRFSSS